MRLYDRVLVHPKTKALVTRWREIEAQTSDVVPRMMPGLHKLDGAVLIDATSVAAFYFEHYGASLPDEFEQLAPIISPPFSATWWESQYLPRMFPNGKFKAWGAFCHAFDLWHYTADLPADKRAGACNQLAQSIADQMAQHETTEWHAVFDTHPTLVGEIRWVAYWWLYLDLGNKIAGPLVEVRQFIQPDGTMARIAKSDLYSVLVEPVSLNFDGCPDEEVISTLKSTIILLNPFFLATSFCHCRNVSLRDTPMPPEKIRHRREKKLGQPLARFTTLEIDPMKKILQSEGNIQHNGLKKALHICRGNFAHYSEDKPLFGKYSGTFWRPAHVRGTAEAGMIGKDYAVKAPRST